MPSKRMSGVMLCVRPNVRANPDRYGRTACPCGARINQGAARARRPAVVGRGLSERLGRTEVDGARLQAPKSGFLMSRWSAGQVGACVGVDAFRAKRGTTD
jgi:hypothetical protein